MTEMSITYSPLCTRRYFLVTNAYRLFYIICLQYELRLTASDNLKENFTTVVIHVKDVNDNPPVFERPTYRTQITEEDDRNLPKRILQVDTIYNLSFHLIKKFLSYKRIIFIF